MRCPGAATVVGVLLLVGGTASQPAAQARPDFSGKWIFDQARTVAASRGRGLPVAAMLGDEFTATQDATSLTMAIRSGSLHVTAVYKLDGSPSVNMSPQGPGQPDIPVTSRASWEADKLVIVTTSTSDVRGTPTPVESRRELWIDAEGSLVLDRTGTPASLVPSTRSVYRRGG